MWGVARLALLLVFDPPTTGELPTMCLTRFGDLLDWGAAAKGMVGEHREAVKWGIFNLSL